MVKRFKQDLAGVSILLPGINSIFYGTAFTETVNADGKIYSNGPFLQQGVVYTYTGKGLFDCDEVAESKSYLQDPEWSISAQGIFNPQTGQLAQGIKYDGIRIEIGRFDTESGELKEEAGLNTIENIELDVDVIELTITGSTADYQLSFVGSENKHNLHGNNIAVYLGTPIRESLLAIADFEHGIMIKGYLLPNAKRVEQEIIVETETVTLGTKLQRQIQQRLEEQGPLTTLPNEHIKAWESKGEFFISC